MRFLTLFSLFALLIIACNGKPNVVNLQKSPEEASKAFFEALSALDYDKAQALGTEETQTQLRYLRADLNMSSDEERAEREKELKLEVKSVNCSEANGKTTCAVCCNAEGGEASVEMVQQDGKWFVSTSFGFQDQKFEDKEQ